MEEQKKQAAMTAARELFCETHFEQGKSCDAPGCVNQEIRHYDEKKLCRSHYGEAFINDLLALFDKWDGVTEVPDRLKYLVGRFYDENEIKLEDEPTLSKVIVHKESHGWAKNEDSLIFKAVCRVFCDYIPTTWEFNCRSLKFSILAKETA